MNILIKMPSSATVVHNMNNLDMNELYKLMNCNNIEVLNIPIFQKEKILLLADEEGKLNQEDFNFEIYFGGIEKKTIVGTVCFVALDDHGRWNGLNTDQIRYIRKQFNEMKSNT